MAASAPTNPAATVASFFLLLALVVVAAGARDIPASAPVVQMQDVVPFTGPMSTEAGPTQPPVSAPVAQEADGVPFTGPMDADAGPHGLVVAAAEGPMTQALASAPVVLFEEEEASAPAPMVGTVSFDRPMSRESRRCDSDARWNDQLCRTVCGMYKFQGYVFAEAAADQQGEGAVPRCCCCPGGASCVQL